ncbi:phosphomethylpyrimidine kinase [Lysinibacillus sp. BF-4]|uniref:bifunctional hydroxymethylpyrimidine kinase/phosphomethylpyrimidine kinase n=1 Tax=Lysinibacillus sp. BF-4 TaxID=1473546 RepID=UPI00050018F1|nr:bifunctional hydroxymethylpyrimidine kinase/phosphomethylpyrimidine kinase [Lysinibacillus sp. BF-4]KFL42865.1 phosphomethylpyrimidine kinase [Lysinibacillus sp. BF-4]
MKVALTIAGSDSGGGAGIQADVKTFQELGTFGTSVITAITAQNTLGVHDVHPIPTATIAAQLDAVLSDFEVAAAKTGMLFSADIIALVSEKLTGRNIPLVIDPVMIAKGGASLLQQQAIEAMKTLLIPLATIITPNIPEAEVLAGMPIKNEADMQVAAQRLLALGTQVVIIKGGHAVNPSHARDYIATKDETFIVETRFVPTTQTHGTGCTFSAALTAELAKGATLREAVVTAKQFIQSAIAHQLHLGAGHGPTNHSAFKRFEPFEVTIYEA